MYRILISTAALTLGLFSQSALAWNCNTLTPRTTVSPQDLTVPKELPVGAVIGTQTVTPTINAYYCFDNENGVVSNQTFGVKAVGTFDSMLNGRRVYKTNIEGVGYSISGSTTDCPGGEATVNGSNTIRGNADTAAMCTKSGGMIAPTLTGKVTVTFYKTAALTDSGIVNAQTVGGLALLNNLMLWFSPEAEIAINSFRVITPACTMFTTSVPVNLKDVNKNAFSGKGSTPGEEHTQSFILPMGCTGGTQVSVKLEGDTHDAMKGVINTTGGDKAASGVGIQLLYNNQPAPLGSDIPVGTSVNGGYFAVPLKARYYQTGDRITTGTANGVMSFTMTYQ